MKGSDMDGAIIRIRPTGFTNYNPDTSIFVKGIPDSTNLDDLYPLLEKFGTVVASYVKKYTD